jgi:hypothetical protein
MILEFISEDISRELGNQFFQQSFGILMGTDYALLVASNSFMPYEAQCKIKLLFMNKCLDVSFNASF